MSMCTRSSEGSVFDFAISFVSEPAKCASACFNTKQIIKSDSAQSKLKKNKCYHIFCESVG